MTDQPLVLLVEDDPHNLKLARDVLELEKPISVRDFPTEVRRHLHEAQRPQ